MRLAVPIKFKRLHKDAVIPQYQTSGAACVDLVATEIILGSDTATVKFGFAGEVPESYKVLLQPRSSFTNSGWVMANSPGVIDADYRGEWMVKFDAIPVDVTGNLEWGYILKYPTFPYKVGDRCIQASVEVNMHMKFKEVEELSPTSRDKGGFGSTGK